MELFNCFSFQLMLVKICSDFSYFLKCVTHIIRVSPSSENTRYMSERSGKCKWSLMNYFGTHSPRPVVIIPQQYKAKKRGKKKTAACSAFICAFIPHSSSHTKHIILSPSPKNIIPLHYMTLALFRNHLRAASYLNTAINQEVSPRCTVTCIP